jgi:hypothetical protein
MIYADLYCDEVYELASGEFLNCETSSEFRSVSEFLNFFSVFLNFSCYLVIESTFSSILTFNMMSFLNFQIVLP